MCLRDKNFTFVLTLLVFCSIATGQVKGQQEGVNAAMRKMEDPERSVRGKEKIDPTFSLFYEIHPAEILEYIKKQELYLLDEDVNRLLAPQHYYTKFNDFLKTKKIHLARIYPEKNCFYGKVITIEKAEGCSEVLPIIGNGSFYSFRLKTNTNETTSAVSNSSIQAERADIHFVGGKLLVGSKTVQGVIGEVSNIDFEALTSKSEVVKLLKAYKAESNFSKMENQKELLKKGIQLGGNTFSTSVSAKLGSTYLLRSIAYGLYSPARQYKEDEIIFLRRLIDSYDIRTDIIVTFKIVGVENDDSLIILWKELQKKSPPVLSN